MPKDKVTITLSADTLACLKGNISATTAAHKALTKAMPAVGTSFVVTCDGDASWSLLQAAKRTCPDAIDAIRIARKVAGLPPDPDPIHG